MALEITSVAEMNLKSISSSFFPLNLRQDIEDNLLENNSEYEDCECNSDHVNDRSDIRSVKFKSFLFPEMGVYFLMLIIAVCFLFLRSESVFDKSS